ncbi:MAG: hypothetical protein JKY56_26830 [Kofleriaceae bacterium]|nr:hypothetical protein [Kofleriaceae bacterium]
MRYFLNFPAIFCFALVACSSKTETKEKPVVSAATEPKEAHAPKHAKAPARISFQLDDSTGEIYIARPANAEGSQISRFVAKRAQAISAWKSIELVLVDGTKKTLSEFKSDSGYFLHQHSGEGVDFVETDSAGKKVLTIGPLVGMHLRTNADLSVAPIIDGKSVLVLEIAGELHQLNPDELRTLKEVPYPDAERSGWSLLDAVTSKIPIAKLASITAHAAGQSESFSQSELQDKSLQLIVRHNKRGELRLKVYRAGKESDEGLRALQKVVVTPLSSLQK